MPNPASKIENMAGLVGGLVTEARQRATKSRYAWPLVNAPNPDCCTPPAHCWRSVSHRTLAHQVAWGATFPLLPKAGKPDYDQALDALELPRAPLVNPTSTTPTEIAPFYDNDSPTDRQSIDNLVLIGLRAKVRFGYGGKQELGGGPWRRSNEYSRALRDFMRQFLSFRLTHTPGRRDPWVNDTPLAYLDRPDGTFVAVPPLLWNTRDTQAYWVSQPTTVNSSPSPVPRLRQFGPSDNIPMVVTGIVDVEGVFVPDPDRCGKEWPGLWCPPQAIRGHRSYDPDFYTRRRAKLDRLANTINSL